MNSTDSDIVASDADIEGSAEVIWSRKSAVLDAGTIEYREAGTGDPIVFVHGLLVNGRLWDGPASLLSKDFRCIVPDWPMGSHRTPMNPDADLSPPGQAELVAAFLDSLGIQRAIIVGNNSGGAVSQIFAAAHPERVDRLVLTNCDTHENFPPFPFSLMPPLARIPGGMRALSAPFRIGAVRRGTFGMLANKRIDPALVDEWMAPSQDPAISRDTRKLVAGVDKRQTIAAAKALESFDRPVLLTWGLEDRFFKVANAQRLAASTPGAVLETIPGAGTFVPLDQPARVAELIGDFARN